MTRYTKTSVHLVLLAAAACGDGSPVAVVSERPTPEAPLSRAELAEELRGLLTGLGGIDAFRLPDREQLDRIPQDANNPLTPAKVRLGQLLYHETGLGVEPFAESGTASYSCASCHFAQAGFQANLPQGLGDGGWGFGVAGEARVARSDGYGPGTLDAQPIRTPSTLNSAYQELMLWNGQFGGVGANVAHRSRWWPGSPLEANRLGFEGLESQAIAGLGVHRMADVERSEVARNPEYLELFAEAFPGDGAVTQVNAGLAIAAFERTLLADRAPWQRWLAGDAAALSTEQLRGAVLFFGRAGCSECHRGPALNSMSFHALGMPDLDRSVAPDRVELAPSAGGVPDHVARGRGGFTDRPEDDYRFKTPQLYNLTDSPFYGHGASFSTVRAVVEYKNEGEPALPVRNLSPSFRRLRLSSSAVSAITAFVEEALYDPDLMRYVPDRLPTGHCTPVNDARAREELGCG